MAEDESTERETLEEDSEETVTVDTDRLFSDLGDAYVVVLSGPNAGDRIAVGDEETVVVGRSPEADHTLDDPAVSKRHIRLYRERIQTFVEDLGSSNGTIVNGERIDSPRHLKGGDTIAVGQNSLLQFAGTKEPAERETAGEEAGNQVLRLGPGGRWFQFGDSAVVDLRGDRPAGRILERLAEAAESDPADPPDAYELNAAGWPEDRVDADAARERVQVAIDRLRGEGLEGVLVERDSGYSLAPAYALAGEELEIRRHPDRRSPPDDASVLDSN